MNEKQKQRNGYTHKVFLMNAKKNEYKQYTNAANKQIKKTHTQKPTIVAYKHAKTSTT